MPPSLQDELMLWQMAGGDRERFRLIRDVDPYSDSWYWYAMELAHGFQLYDPDEADDATTTAETD